MSINDNGRVVLWKNPKYVKGEKQPYARGKLTAHRVIAEGEEIEVALWLSDKVGEKMPIFSGKLSDPMRAAPPRQAPAPRPAASADFDDDLPF